MIILFALLGLAVGSFLNVCIDRLPRGQSLLSPPSSCPACGQRLAAPDLVPVFSFVLLGGHCRYCGASIGYRSLLVEMAAGILFALLWWRSGAGLTLGLLCFYGALFLVIAVIDLERRLVLNSIIYPSMALALIFAFFWQSTGVPATFWPGTGPLSALLGGAIGLAALALPNAVSRGGMGWGDVKLAGLIGLVVGFPLVGVALFIALVGGGIGGGAILLIRRRRHQFIPFAPFLAAGAFVALLWGEPLLSGYLRLLHAG